MWGFLALVVNTSARSFHAWIKASIARRTLDGVEVLYGKRYRGGFICLVLHLIPYSVVFRELMIKCVVALPLCIRVRVVCRNKIVSDLSIMNLEWVKRRQVLRMMCIWKIYIPNWLWSLKSIKSRFRLSVTTPGAVFFDFLLFMLRRLRGFPYHSPFKRRLQQKSRPPGKQF